MMLSLPKYDCYKDSGVDWLGEIPTHWEVKKLKHIANFRLSNVDKHTRTNEKEVKLCNYTDVYYQKFITENIKFMVATATEEQIKNFTLEKGDVLITKDSETPDDIAVPAYVSQSLTNVICGYHLAHIKPVSIYGKYLFYAFQSTIIASQFHISATGITRYGIGKSDIANSLFLIPPIAEQEKIVKFLDRKCEEVERAIELKQRLITLLDEQKSIVINQAVTKGLNPNAPMKDSGIDWLGDIPAHWELKKLKHIVNFRLSNVDKHIRLNEKEVKLCNYTDVYYQKFITENINFMVATATEEQIKNFSLEKGDVLITKDSETPDDIAVPAYVSEPLTNVICGYHLAHIKPVSIQGKYLFYGFQSKIIASQFHISATGITRYGIGKSDIANSLFLIPPIEEQEKIVKYLEQKTAEIEELKEKTLQQIEKLKEFKQILIAEAVTGKIKV
jgi:type I restriction enzyme S subunit